MTSDPDASPDDPAAGPLAANRAFYQAFQDRDADAMDRVWSRGAPVACIHPGRAALVGRGAVMASWRAILGPRPGGEPGPAVSARAETVHLHGTAALVLCEEVIGTAVLSAANLFVLEDGAWRMVHHQAGQQVPVAGAKAVAATRQDDKADRPQVIRPRTLH